MRINCPICGDRFSLRKPHGTVWYERPGPDVMKGKAICGQCAIERQEIAERALLHGLPEATERAGISSAAVRGRRSIKHVVPYPIRREGAA